MAGPPPLPEGGFDPEWAAEDKGPVIIAVIVTVTSIATLFTAARLYVRGIIMRNLQLDDYLIVVALLCGWAAVAFGIAATIFGNGKHFDVLTEEQKSGAILWTIVGFCPGIMSFGIPKLAVIHLLTRLMNPNRPHRIFLWGLGIVCNISLLGCVVIFFAQCTPVRSQWDFSLEATCWNKYVLVYYAIYSGALSAATDLYLAIYPAVVLFNLQITLQKKLALSAALGIGSIATVVAVYKTTRVPNLASEDFSFDTSDLVIWTCVEGSTIIIAACIPVLQPLAEKFIGTSLFGSSYNNNRNYKNYGSERSGPLPSDIALSYHGRKRPVADPNGLTFLDRGGSEESILGGNNGTKSTSSAASAPARPKSMNIPHGGIVRTDVVTVLHSPASDQILEAIDERGRRHF